MDEFLIRACLNCFMKALVKSCNNDVYWLLGLCRGVTVVKYFVIVKQDTVRWRDSKLFACLICYFCMTESASCWKKECLKKSS